MSTKLVEYLDVDDDINVYVVGDIHGCYNTLLDALIRANFDFERDLCIGVGDLVDRGENSLKCVELVDKKWFKTVKGNHEDFCIKGYSDYSIEFYHKMPNNGGEWFYSLDNTTKQNIIAVFNSLPILLEVNYKGRKFGFVHADLPYQDWELVKECLKNNDELNGRSIADHCMWVRDLVYRDNVNIAQVDHVFFGHTPLKQIQTSGNCTFLDTGAVFSKYDSAYHLSVVNLNNYLG